ncbi:MAG TPA: HPr family phosphocarrier protein [Acidiferrobacteraceae bacterium]|nr:HPr family phosphocarrier protein [Acidiferrobacteraceae bacterium]HEX19348.1 HPr family phosphocarrier protein [Acidiferrobacteraceae bacterium]
MTCKDAMITNKLGMHARAAAKFVSLANNYNSEISLIKDEKTVNGKSIMGIMMLAAAMGTELRICANGDDETEACTSLIDLVNDKFGEKE